MTGKPLERSAWGDCPQILFGNRCGRKRDVSRRRDEIDPDTDDDKLRGLTLTELGFEEDSGYLAATQQHVIRPFIGEPIEPSFGGRPQRVAYGQHRDETELRRLIYRTLRPQDQRNVEIARWRSPGASA